MLYCLRCQGDLSQLTAREVALGLRISLADLEKTYLVFQEKASSSRTGASRNGRARRAPPSDPTAADRMRNYRRRRSERNGAVTANGRPDVPPPAEKEGGANKEQPARARPAVTLAVTGPEPTPGPEPRDPAYDDVARLAEEPTGTNRKWAGWVREMEQDGFPADWITKVLNKLRARGRWSQKYGRGILEDFRHHGGPDRPASTGPAGANRATRPAPPAAPVRAIECRHAAADAYGDAFRLMWAEAGPPASLGEARAREVSQDCPYCSGSGWVGLVRRRKPGPDQPMSAATRAPRSQVHCLCPIGEWMRCRTPLDLIGRMPDLAAVLAGRAQWDLEMGG